MADRPVYGLGICGGALGLELGLECAIPNYRTVVISRAGSIGATPGEIKEAAIKAGVEVNPGYPYSVIQKLKLRGVIKETSSGRYTLVKTKKRQ